MEDTDNSAVPKNEQKVPKPTVQVRKAKKKKKSLADRKEYDVKVIPATKGVDAPSETPRVKRVAAYCRVSTDEDAQATSFDLQVKHYTEYIGAHVPVFMQMRVFQVPR